MPQTKTVELFTLSTCPWCRQAKAFLSGKGVAFAYVDYDLAEGDVQGRIQDEMTANHASSFPYTKIGADFVVGYNPDAYTRLLELEQAEPVVARALDVEHAEPLDLAAGSKSDSAARAETDRAAGEEADLAAGVDSLRGVVEEPSRGDAAPAASPSEE